MIHAMKRVAYGERLRTTSNYQPNVTCAMQHIDGQYTSGDVRFMVLPWTALDCPNLAGVQDEHSQKANQTQLV